MGAGTVVSSHTILAKLKSTYKQHNSIIWKFIFLAQLLLIANLTAKLSRELLGGGAELKEFHNSQCMDNGAPSLDGVKLNGTVDGDCVYDYNFKKILYFWCDGISWDTAGPIFDNFPEDSNIFKVRHRANPWSAWVFSSYMTGKSDRNMGTVKNDNMMYQFWLAGMKSYISAGDNRAYVFGQLDLDYQQNDIEFYDWYHDDYTRMFQWFFQCGDDVEVCVNNTLNNVKKDNRSMFFESLILDHAVHGVHSKYHKEVLAMRDQLASDLAHVKNWVDQNPEYLLVVVSDHGQQVSIAEPEIHGKWLTPGNEAWMVVYNPNIDTHVSLAANPVILNTVDVAPTLWQFFSTSGASIPAESVGKVYPVAADDITKYKALKTNAIQLRTYLKREKPFKFDDSKYNSAKTNYEAGAYDKAVLEMEEYVAALSDRFVEEGNKLPMKLPLFSALVFFVLTLMVQFGSRNNMWAAARSVGYGVIASPYLIWILVIVVFTQASDFSDRHRIYDYAIPMLAFLASYTLRHFVKTAAPQEKQGHHRLLSVELNEDCESKVTNDCKTALTDSSDEISDDGVSETEACKSTGIDMPPIVEEKKQFLYFELWDNLRQKNFKEAALLPLNYILGAFKVPRSSADFWLMYAVVVFVVFNCFEIPLAHKRFLFSDINGLEKVPKFWRGLAIGVLFLEFRWQRIVLTSNLDMKSCKLHPFLQQIIHPAFWPLNIKTIVYFVLLCLSFSAEPSTARFIYAVTFLHIVVLLVMPSHLQRDLFLPLFILTFLIDTSKEKLLQCFYVVVLHFFSNTMEKKCAANKHVLPFIMVAMISLSHFYFAVLVGTPYSIDSLNLNVPGIEDITKYPNFSVMMMGIHYLSVFLMLVPFLVRLATPAPPALRPFKIGFITFGHVPVPHPTGFKDPTNSVTKHNRRYILTFLTFGSALSVILYYIFSMSERSDIPLIWAFVICTVTIGYGATVVGSEIADGLVKLLILAIRKIAAKF